MKRVATAVAAAVMAAACAQAPSEPSTVRLYTSVTEDTVQAVVDGFQIANPEITVEVFRAPTGELTARIEAERREGEVLADLLWLTDPLSMQQYEADGLLAAWTPVESGVVPDAYHSSTFWGTRLLNMVIVSGEEAPAVVAWEDLTDPDLEGKVAIPDPAFAGSAFAALAFFALSPDYGLDYYRALKENGAVQVKAPGDVVTGVAEGQFLAGMTLDNTARVAIEKGSPINMVWPEPGAIALYSPIAIVATATEEAATFANYVLGPAAQQAIATTGWQPIRSDLDWSEGGPQVAVDWALAFGQQQELLDQYLSIFGA
jgi:iron(III) transport system substrate-binding protein